MDREEPRIFPVGLAVGLAFGVVVALVAILVLDADYGIPIAILIAILVAGAFAMRAVGGRSRGVGASNDGQLPKNPPQEGPLGGTPEGHSELSAHDIPKGSPEREAVEHAAQEDR